MTAKPRKDPRPPAPAAGVKWQEEPLLFQPIPEDTGYTVEDAYRLLAGLPLTPVETTPVE